MFKCIFWDVDNTLLDFLAAEKVALKTGFARFGLGECTDEMVKEYSAINNRYWQALERGEITKDRVLVGRYEEFLGNHGIDPGISSDFNDFYQLELGETICYMDNSLELVKGLKGKVIQCAASNGTKVAQDKKLRKSGFDQLMDEIFISEELGYEKPSAAFFESAYSRLQKDFGTVKKEEILMVGDSLTSDMRGANNFGIPCCWYNPSGKGDPKDLWIDWRIKDLWEVPEILEKES